MHRTRSLFIGIFGKKFRVMCVLSQIYGRMIDLRVSPGQSEYSDKYSLITLAQENSYHLYDFLTFTLEWA